MWSFHCTFKENVCPLHQRSTNSCIKEFGDDASALWRKLRVRSVHSDRLQAVHYVPFQKYGAVAMLRGQSALVWDDTRGPVGTVAGWKEFCAAKVRGCEIRM
jgi:hypothetical protein